MKDKIISWIIWVIIWWIIVFWYSSFFTEIQNDNPWASWVWWKGWTEITEEQLEIIAEKQWITVEELKAKSDEKIRPNKSSNRSE